MQGDIEHQEPNQFLMWHNISKHDHGRALPGINTSCQAP